eukprot:355593-Chlamydomonas_euryale.AAC.3
MAPSRGSAAPPPPLHVSARTADAKTPRGRRAAPASSRPVSAGGSTEKARTYSASRERAGPAAASAYTFAPQIDPGPPWGSSPTDHLGPPLPSTRPLATRLPIHTAAVAPERLLRGVEAAAGGRRPLRRRRRRRPLLPVQNTPARRGRARDVRLTGPICAAPVHAVSVARRRAALELLPRHNCSSSSCVWQLGWLGKAARLPSGVVLSPLQCLQLASVRCQQPCTHAVWTA